MLFGILAALVIAPTVIIAVLTILRKGRYPEKSYYNCFLNVILGPMRYFKIGPYKQGKLDLQKAIRYAMKKTGLQDFGDTTFLDAYNVIFNTPAHQNLKLTNLGYIMYQIELNQTMLRRLTFLQYLKDCPQITDVPVRSPVFVLGLPRTGTTFLHRLLSLDPAVRAPLLWELLAPVPKVRGESKVETFENDRNKRANAMRKLIKTRQSMGDNALQHIHEIDADLPEECIMALTDELPIHMSCLYSAYMNFEIFLKENSGQRAINAYKHYKKVLQLLSYQVGEAKEPRRWMLKCPIHLFYIKEIANVFPDAKLVWTHRHPVSAIPSMCSLVKSLHQVYYTNETRDDAMLGKKIRDISHQYLLQTASDIETTGLDCANINYENLVKDPIGTVKNIYNQFGWKVSDEYEKILKNYLHEDSLKRESKKKELNHNKGVLHFYTPEEFSLTSNELCEGNFNEYTKKFNVPMSKN